MFSEKSLLITGGTGSFGNAVLERFLDSNIKEIRIFSRDEKKQDDMRKLYSNDKLKFYIGDVRDVSSLNYAMENVNFVFHAAALKQVPSCEFYPLEAFKTNVLGTENVLEAAISFGVDKVICLSTDKAVYPINAMGISKAMMEKVAIAKSKISSKTKICITRYGNVIGSRGSVVPLFINQILAGKKLTVTDFNMTRFMMTLEEAVNLVIFAFQNCNTGDIFVQKSPATTIANLIQALKEIFNIERNIEHIIGTRHGEKLYEVLLSREEMVYAEDLDSYFRLSSDTRNLNYEKYVESGELKISAATEYNSHNTKRLDISSTKELLMKLDFIKKALNTNLTN